MGTALPQNYLAFKLCYSSEKPGLCFGRPFLDAFESNWIQQVQGAVEVT